MAAGADTSIDFTVFWFTMALLLIGVLYACVCAYLGGDEDAGEPDALQSAPPPPAARPGSRAAARRGGRAQARIMAFDATRRKRRRRRG
jgi:hypothetical protein